MYGFYSWHKQFLVTIVVVDEYGEGYPVAWCLSNREDQFALENFLKPIRKRIGSITPAWFMSDDAEQYHNAWRSVFGEVDNKLLCTWHVMEKRKKQKLQYTIA